MNSMLCLLGVGVAARLEFMLELMESNMRRDAKHCLEDKPSISLSFSGMDWTMEGSGGEGYACRGEGLPNIYKL